MASDLPNSENLNTKNGNFICGVIEGFYGRPWTTEQRRDLFQNMAKWGMDSYVYAPKDDCKHRKYWRELYTVEEAEHLTGVIQAAKDNNITFYYAISPGLDITYSSLKEIATLKQKLEQVLLFGCTAFALLFDDIESEISEADKEVFQSFAQAQVSVTNDVYKHLGKPKFMLCPTQYCSVMAEPNVTDSEYLNTLGRKLAPEIDVMWTGETVVSRHISKENIQEITEILRRPPVIWDNLSANDYDQKRVHLGPYSERSPDLIPKLRGVMTNPNCEYWANFVAIHTLAQWSRCSLDGQRSLSINDSVSADIKVETKTENGVTGENVPAALSPNMYDPRQALKNAIKDWLPEFFKQKAAWGPIAKQQAAVLNGATVKPQHTETGEKRIASDILSDSTSTFNGDGQPNGCRGSSSGTTQVESSGANYMVAENQLENQRKTADLTFEDLELLCDLFYLPFEHGEQGKQLVQEFKWLKSNAHLVIAANQNNDTSSPEVQEWFSKAQKLDEMVQAVSKLFEHLSGVNNRELSYDLHPYIWDLRIDVSFVNSYIKKLGSSKGYKETFLSGDQEPWVYRGGLSAELLRLLPAAPGDDLYVYKAPDAPTSRVYMIRPYLATDKEQVYKVCIKTYKGSLEEQNSYPQKLKEIQADRMVGPYLTLHPEFCFVVEDECGIVGYACAAPDYKKFKLKQEIAWIPEMCHKYPKHLAKDMPKSLQGCVNHFHSFKDEVDVTSSTHPSGMVCSLLPSVWDQSVSKRLVTCLSATLKANGSSGVHVVMNSTDSDTQAFYKKLGFIENTHESVQGNIVMGRTF